VSYPDGGVQEGYIVEATALGKAEVNDMVDARGYLEPAVQRSNVTFSTGSQARRLLFQGTRCVGVEYAKDGKQETARPKREVVRLLGGDRVTQAAPVKRDDICLELFLAADVAAQPPAGGDGPQGPGWRHLAFLVD